MALFYKSKINSHGVYIIKNKIGWKVLFKSNKRICVTVKSNFNNSETDNLNTSNSDDVIGNSNVPCIDVHTKISFK